ncbi:hypothetical protein [Kiloniella majae]|uniref:hypothetical protein n=1 Tax=Kiloniella majae TaxID=1938558 RepID=UPI000A278D4B|nr:hypothetical protein [Kiloniella majae]
MGTIHFFLNGKGGVGTSFTASLLTQHYIARNKKVLCVSTEPGGGTLSRYQVFHTKWFDIYCDDPADPKSIDSLFNMILRTDDETEVIVDCGSRSYLCICEALKEKGFLDEARSFGKRTLLHSIIVGGASEAEALNSYRSLMDNFPDSHVMIWLNGYFGEILIDEQNFESTRFYSHYEDRIDGLIPLGPERGDLMAHDINRMLCDYFTFQEAITTSDYYILTKSRLNMFWRDLNAKLDAVNL